MPGLPSIEWRVHLTSAPEAVFEAWTTDRGRTRFWAEESRATDGGFTLSFVNGRRLDVPIVESAPPIRFAFRYFGGSAVRLDFASDGDGGCDLTLRETGVPEAEHVDNYAGWVSVLLTLKAALDFAVDLRGHDGSRSWEQRYVDN